MSVSADFGPCVVTIGNFDGVHFGHRQIARRVAAIAKERGLTPVLLTFEPHPAKVLAPDRAPKLIGTIGQRVRRLKGEGIAEVVLFPFSAEFALQSPEEFAAGVLRDRLHTSVVLVGEDFRFGYRQAGDIQTLRELGARYGFEVESISAILRKGERVSSTAIRKLVEAGKVSRAARLLGAPFALEGRVVKGHGIGAKQTVPTLNLRPENELLPKTGVYVTRTRDLESGREWPSITNVGYRPTFTDAGDRTVETFLLTPLTGDSPEHLEVEFLAWVREERKFESPEALRAQILRDAKVAGTLHRRLTGMRAKRAVRE